MFGLTTMFWCNYPKVMGSFTVKQVHLNFIHYSHTAILFLQFLFMFKGGRNIAVSIVTYCGLGGLGFKFWWWHFFGPNQTHPEAQPASCKMSKRSVSWR